MFQWLKTGAAALGIVAATAFGAAAEDWKPAKTEYWCEYAYDWIRIKDTWGLTVTQDEWNALMLMISTCPDGYVYENAYPKSFLEG